MKDDWKNDFQSSFFMLIIIINDYPQNYPYEDESSNYHGQMKAVITTDSISLLPLRGRHLPFTRPRAATLSVAITAYIIMFEVILRIII